jgi:hypothetical protein
MDKVKYRCTCCGWSKELPLEWSDVKPRFCPTPTCEMSVKKSKGKKSFRLMPDKLQITEIVAPAPLEQDTKQSTKKKFKR